MENGHLKQTLLLHSEKLGEIEEILSAISINSGKLVDVLEGIKTELSLMRSDVMSVATGKGTVPKEALDSVAKAHMSIHKALCLVILAMTLWFTGLKYLAPHIFGGS